MTETGDPTAPVRAAGTLCWRPAPDRSSGSSRTRPGSAVQIRIVHRPRYDDWSLPKGHVNSGEVAQVCAARETVEETGAVVELGVALPGVAYALPDGRAKQVSYWAARAVTEVPRTDPAEVDRTIWLDLPAVCDRLSYPDEFAVVQAAAELAEAGRLHTVPIILMPHTQARPQDSWPRADSERPLVGSGRRRARAAAELLTCWQPHLLLSSPYRRCTETLEPFARQQHRKIITKGGLGVEGFARAPGKALKHLRRALLEHRPTVICSHSAIVSAMIESLAPACPERVVSTLPGPENPLGDGEMLVIHLSRANDQPEIAAAERVSFI